MILLILRHWMGFLPERRFDGSGVRLRRDGSMSTVTLFEGQGETIEDRRDDTLNIGVVLALLRGGAICKPGKRLAKKNC